MAQTPVPNDGTKYVRDDGSPAVGQVMEGGPFGERGVFTDSQGKQVFKEDQVPKPGGASAEAIEALRQEVSDLKLKIGGLTLEVKKLRAAIEG